MSYYGVAVAARPVALSHGPVVPALLLLWLPMAPWLLLVDLLESPGPLESLADPLEFPLDPLESPADPLESPGPLEFPGDP